MAYTLNINDNEEEKKVVQSIMSRERDIFDHEQTLERFSKILEDESFVGSTMDTPQWKITYRQKIEQEIPVLQGRIAECKALIKSMEDLGKIPSQQKINQIVQELSQANQ